MSLKTETRKRMQYRETQRGRNGMLLAGVAVVLFCGAVWGQAVPSASNTEATDKETPSTAANTNVKKEKKVLKPRVAPSNVLSGDGKNRIVTQPRLIAPALGLGAVTPAMKAGKTDAAKDQTAKEAAPAGDATATSSGGIGTAGQGSGPAGKSLPGGKPLKEPPEGEKPPWQKGIAGAEGGESDEITVKELRAGIDFKKKSEGYRFTFNLQDVTLEDLIRIIANITGKRFILGGKMRNITATIYAPTKITVNEAYRAFLSVLEVNGLTAVPSGSYYKIVESAGAVQRALPIYNEKEQVPPEDRIITRIQKLTNVSADEIAQLLGRFKSKDGDLTVYAPTNTIIITDYGSNIERLARFATEFDVPGTGEQIYVEPVHYADATDLADRLLEVFEAESGSKTTKRKTGSAAPAAQKGFAATVGQEASETKLSKIIADERTNLLLIMASEQTYLRILELIRHLDIPVPGEGEIHVHPLEHADSTELSQTLSTLTQGKGAKTKGQTGGQAAGELFEGEVKISADKATNSLVIVSSLRDYIHLKSVIEQLDVMRRQVFVEAVIMEVSLDKQRMFGLAFHAGTTLDTSQGTAVMFGGTQLGGINSVVMDPSSLMGLAAGLRGPELAGTEGLLGPGISIPAFGVALQALQDNNDVNVLSTPHVLATDNIMSELSVGGNVPMQQGFAQGLGSILGAAAASGGASTTSTSNLGGLLSPMVSVGRQNVGLTLKLTPHINKDNEVRLEIDIDISEVSGESSLGPILSKKTAKTTSIVQDQQTVVLGGLITDNQTETTEKVPVLGDIPIIGYLFKHTKSHLSKRNLLIFLTPYIIRDQSDFRRIFNRKMAERREFIERYTAFADHRVDPDLDYSRTNGVLEEINQTLREVETEERLRKESEAKPPPEHVPSKPITFPPGVAFDSGGRGTGEGGEESGRGEPPANQGGGEGDNQGAPPAEIENAVPIQ